MADIINTSSFHDWYQSLPIPWLVGNPVGQAEAGALGDVLDGQVDQLDQATKARMPSLAPVDALPHIANNCGGLIQGPTESNAAFALRLQCADQQWQFAGSALGILVQLYYQGLAPYAVLVQQNGIALTLTGTLPPFVVGQPWNPSPNLVQSMLGPNPLITTNPTTPIVITTLNNGPLGTMQFTWTTGLNSVGGTVTTVAGSDFWWQCPGTTSWVMFPAASYLGSSIWIFQPDGTITLGGAAFSGVLAYNTPWWSFDLNNGFTSRYALLFPTLPPSWTAPVSPPTPSTAPTLSQVNTIRSILKGWAAGKATCMGIYAQTSGKLIGYPIRLINSGAYSGSTIGPSTTVVFTP